MTSTDSEHKALMSLRHKGYAVVVFTPEELNGSKAKYVEERMIEAGWNAISWLEDTWEENSARA